MGQLVFVAQIAGWDPGGWEDAHVEQRGQAASIELVGLMDMAHHRFGLGGMGQQR